MFFDADSSNLKDKIAKDTSIVKGIFNTPFSTTISLRKTPWRTSSTFSKPNIAIIGMAYYKQYLVEKSFRKVFRVYLFSTKRDGIDVDIFRAYSAKAVSTSKAYLCSRTCFS